MLDESGIRADGAERAGWRPSVRVRRLVPGAIRRAAARLIAAHRATEIERQLSALARSSRPILAGPWLGEVGFELLYWIPFVRWFRARYEISPDRLIAVSRGGGARAWYTSLAARNYDALAFMSQDEFRQKNAARTGHLGEQKQIASTPLDEEIVARVRGCEQRDLAVLHPAMMYRLFAPYWWGHQPLEWIYRYAQFEPFRPPGLDFRLPPSYTAVKFYFNDCFRNTVENRAFVDRRIRELSNEGPVISLSTGIAVDDHDPCDPDIAAMHGIRHLLAPETNLAVQSAIVAGARRFVGTYGGFAYLAPLCGVPAVTYYSEPGSYSLRHLDLVQHVLSSTPATGTLALTRVPEGNT